VYVSENFVCYAVTMLLLRKYMKIILLVCNLLSEHPIFKTQIKSIVCFIKEKYELGSRNYRNILFGF
jgi:hypothetical protein